jgi:ribosomal protein L20A (L18A)
MVTYVNIAVEYYYLSNIFGGKHEAPRPRSKIKDIVSIEHACC